MDLSPNALAQFEDIVGAAKGRRLVVFLDFDGTLTPIAPRPDLAVLSEGTRRALRDLGRICTVAVVSGRALGDVAALVGLDELYYVGCHGLDISGPKSTHIKHQEGADYIPLVAGAERELREGVSGVAGALVEGKGFSVAVHYRLVAEKDLAALYDFLSTVAARHPSLRVTGGKKIWELRPAMDWDKGKAVLWLLDALDLGDAAVLPIYIGDDRTDEDAFEALRDRGLGIMVTEAPEKTAARYCLKDSSEVRIFLERLTAHAKSAPDKT